MTLGRFALVTLGAVVAMTSIAATASAADGDWTNRITVGGQLDVRMERDLNTAYASQGATGTGDDLYTRVRAKLTVGAKINDSLMANFRIATGKNQYTTWATLGQSSDAQGGTAGFSERKDFMLDYAYFDYTGLSGFDIQLGKDPILFWTPGGTEMVWNLQNSTEGANIKWAGDMGSLKPWAIFNYSTVLNKVNGTPANPSSTSDGADVTLLALQLGLKWQTQDQWLAFDLANYEYNNVQGLAITATGQTSSATSMNGNSGSMGNSTDASGTLFGTNFNMVQAGLEYGYNFGFAPVKVYADYVNNTMVGTNNVGFLGGVTAGALKDVGSWNATAKYRDVRQDATLGAYGDIAFLNGGTNLFGAEYDVNYQAWQNAAVGVTYDNGKKNVTNNGGSAYEIYLLTMSSKF